MAWLVGIAVVVPVLFALAWWSSGRAKPASRRSETPWTAAQEDHHARAQGGGYSSL